MSSKDSKYTRSSVAGRDESSCCPGLENNVTSPADDSSGSCAGCPAADDDL